MKTIFLSLLLAITVFGQDVRSLVLFDEKSYETVKKVGRESCESARPERFSFCPGASHFEWLAKNTTGQKNGVERIAVVTASINNQYPCMLLKTRRLIEGAFRSPPKLLNTNKASPNSSSGSQSNYQLELIGLTEKVRAEIGLTPILPLTVAFVFLDSGFGPHPGFDPSRIDTLQGNPPDIDGHGTSVAGTGAADSKSPYGVQAPSQQAMLVPIQVNKRDEAGQTYTDQVLALRSILSLRKLPYELLIVNMSFEIWESVEERKKWDVWSQVLDSMKDKAQFFAGAGNDQRNKTENIQPCVSSYLENVACVAGVDRNNSFFGTGSSRGPEVTMSAPWDVYTTTLASRGSLSGWRSGTSYSTPLCAAVGALLVEEAKGKFPNFQFTPRLVEKILVRALQLAPELIGLTGNPGVCNVPNALEEMAKAVSNGGQVSDLALGQVDKDLGKDKVLGSWSGKRSLARGDLVSIYGTSLDGYQVYFNGRKLELSYTSDTQLNFALPPASAILAYRTPNVLAIVKSVDGREIPETVQILSAEFAPSEALGIGGIYRENGEVSGENPARPGDILTILLSGAVGTKSATVLLGGLSIMTEVKELPGSVQAISFTLPDLPSQYGIYGKVQVGHSSAEFGFNYTQ